MFNVEVKLEWCLITDKHIHQPQWSSSQKISLKLERSDVYALQRALVLHTHTNEDVVVPGQFDVTAIPVHRHLNTTSGYYTEDSAPKLTYNRVRLFLQASTRTLVMQTWEDGEWGTVVAEFASTQIHNEITQANRYLLGHVAIPTEVFEQYPNTLRFRISYERTLDLIPFTTQRGETTMVLRTARIGEPGQPPALNMYVRKSFEDTGIWWPTKDLSGGEILKFNDTTLF